MQIADIDELAACIRKENFGRLAQLANRNEISTDAEMAEGYRAETIIKELMLKIEKDKDLMEYTKEKSLGEYKGILSNFFVFFTNIENLKYFVENSKKYGISSFGIKELLKETKDSEYIKECIANREKYGIRKHHIEELIISTRDSEYIKKCIKDRYIYNFDSYTIKKMAIATNDSEYIKRCINDREKYGFDIFQLTELVAATDDGEYIKEIIENREQHKLYFYVPMIIKLIKATKDSEYIKKCIEDRGKYELDNFSIKDLIKATKDSEYIKRCIENREKYGFDIYTIKELIISTSDSEYIKKCIENRQQYGFDNFTTKNLIKATKDLEYIKSCIENREEYGFSTSTIKDLIIETNDPGYIKKCIEDRKKYGFSVATIKNLIKATKDSEYIKSSLNDRKKFGFENYMIKELIIATKEIEYIEKCINDIENFGLNKSEIISIIVATRNLEYIRERIGDSAHNELNDIKNKINIPENMTFGIEIESEGKMSNDIKILSDIICKEWICKGESSLDNGVEVVSPVLNVNSSTISDIDRVCKILNSCGQNVTNKCGGHIHIGADYLTNIEAYKNLIEIWGNTEFILYTICNEKGNIPRNETYKYSAPISRKIQNAIDDREINLQNEEDLQKFITNLQSIQETRFSGINFENIVQDGKNTIEFRLANGTINPDTWIENINLFGGIVAVAQELSIIQKKRQEDRLASEIEKLGLFERIKSNELNDKEKLEILLSLAIKEGQEQIYIDRYEENSKLIKQDNFLLKGLQNKVANRNIILRKSDIGKIAFAGNNPICKEEYEECSNIINQHLKVEQEPEITF